MDVTLPVEVLRQLVRQPNSMQLFLNLPYSHERRFHECIRITIEERVSGPVFYFQHEQDGRIIAEQAMTLGEVFEFVPRLQQALGLLVEFQADKK